MQAVFASYTFFEIRISASPCQLVMYEIASHLRAPAGSLFLLARGWTRLVQRL